MRYHASSRQRSRLQTSTPTASRICGHRFCLPRERDCMFVEREYCEQPTKSEGASFGVNSRLRPHS